MTNWQLDDLKIEGEIVGVKFSYDLGGLINQIGSNDEAPPKEEVKACVESVQMAFKKDTYKIYPSNTDFACKQLEEAPEARLRMGRKLLLKSPWTLSLKEYLSRKPTIPLLTMYLL